MKFEATDHSGDRVRISTSLGRMYITTFSEDGERRIDVVLDVDQTETLKRALA